jgi:hypothetical protein
MYDRRKNLYKDNSLKTKRNRWLAFILQKTPQLDFTYQFSHTILNNALNMISTFVLLSLVETAADGLLVIECIILPVANQ